MGLAAALATVCLPDSPLTAQTATGRLTGLVKDQSGAALPGVTVTAVQHATSTSRTAVSGTNGEWTLAFLLVLKVRF